MSFEAWNPKRASIVRISFQHIPLKDIDCAMEALPKCMSLTASPLALPG